MKTIFTFLHCVPSWPLGYQYFPQLSPLRHINMCSALSMLVCDTTVYSYFILGFYHIYVIGVSPLILNLGARRSYVVSFAPRPLFSRHSRKVLTVKTQVSWCVTPCQQIRSYRLFGREWWLLNLLRPESGSSKLVRRVVNYIPVNTAKFRHTGICLSIAVGTQVLY